ncbi:NHS-like protein 3 [Anguilla rostrata]|uniref:NHS-like protein 3 n=1 Tax=Anguilla rostrata TaxID=7938 RepID=UPI0030D44C4D
MSLQRSVGDLVPQDIAEILARERHGSKGRKRRGGSLGRAFRWLKARRKKKGAAAGGGGANGLARVAGDGRVGKHAHQHGHDAAKGLPKQEQETRPSLSPLYPENVFVEGDRPQFLQDLHTEAQEGLKIQQQEENGMDYQDDESMVSTTTLQTGDDTSLASSMRTVGSGDTTDAMSSVSTVSGVSAVSPVSEVSAVSVASTASTRSSRLTRSGLTRQASTFKPLSGSRRPEKGRRRSKRATVAGIPQHVQRELGLDRERWQTSPTEGQLPNGQDVEEEVDVLPDPGGTPEGVRIHLAALEGLESAEEQQLLRRHLQAVYRDDLAMARTAGPRLSPGRRVKSVAVPGLTTAAPATLSAAPPPASSPADPYPSSPVMYISPQATYMSKIIPNAVLPGDVDVIEISRKGRSRGSMRTLSKTSLTAPSPALSRASWTGSDSSHTVVSDSSTISSGGGRGRRKKQGAGPPGGAHPASPDQVSLHSSISYSSNITSVSQVGGDSRRSDAYFGRSLSVKKTKKDPPAPPRRTNSLHPSRLRRRSRDVPDAPAPSPSLAYSADQSQVSSSSSSSSTVASLPKMQGNGFHRTLSPSSGYCSQSPVPTLSPYSGNPTQQRAPPALPKASSLMTAVLGFGGAPPDVPAHPKVKAPTPPPPETWIHDQRSFDLLCGPLSVQRNLFVALQKVRLERQRRQAQCPLVAGGEASAAGQRKEPPPVMKKTGLVKTEVLKHAGPAAVRKGSPLTQVYVQTPPPSPPPAHHPPPPPAKETPPSSVSDSAWPLPPPPAVELLPAAVFEGPDETDFLPPPPLQEGAGSPPVSANVQLVPPVKTTPLVTAPPTLVTVKSMPPAAQEGTPPAAIVTAVKAIMPNNTAKVTQASAEPGRPPPCSTNSLEMSLLLQGIPPPPKEAPPPPPDARSVLQGVPPPPLGIPPPPQEAPPLPPETRPVLQGVPLPPLGIPPPPQEAPPPPPEAPPVLKEVHPPPQKAPPVPQEVLLPPQEAPPVPQEVLPPPQEAPPVTLEVLPPPHEAPPVTQEVLPLSQEAPTVPQEVLLPLQEAPPVPQEVQPPAEEAPPILQEVVPPTQEAPPVPQEVLPPPKEAPPVTLEVLPPPQEAPPVPQEVLPAPQEAPPVPQEVLPPPQEAPPVPQEVPPPAQEAPPVLQEVPPTPEEVKTSFPAVPTVPPPPPAQPLEEQTPPTCPAEPGPTNQETQSREPQAKSSPTPKRDARVPMTTSTLMQMVRMRAGESTGAPVQNSKPRDAGEKPGHGQNQNQNQADGQSAAEKPKTLPVTAPPPTINHPPPATGSAPSMRLQEAIRMKTAAMSRLGSRSPRSASPSPSPSSPSPSSPSPASPSPASPSPASTASFIFAKSPRKVVIETPSSPEGQAGLKADLAAELARVTGPAKNAKVPPPVAKKPAQHTDQAPPPDQTATENGGVAAPAEETPGALPKENPESSNAKPAGGAQPASTDQVTLSPPP